MSVTTPPSSQLSYLDGLKTLFLQQLCVHREEYGKPGDMIENFKVSAVYTYSLKNWFDENWKIWEEPKPVVKRKLSFSDDFESWGDDDDDDTTMSEKKQSVQQLYEPEVHQLQFGSLNDPLRSLTLSALFPLSQDTLFDDAYQTNMDALTAKQWQISRELAPKSQQRAYLSTLLEQAIGSWNKDPSNKDYIASYDDSNDDSISESISLMRNLFAPANSHTMGSGDQQVNFFKSDQVDNVINALFESMQSPIEEETATKGFLSTKQLCLRLKTGSSVPYRSFLWNLMLYTLEEASPTSENGKKQNASNFLGFLKIIWLEVLRKIRWHWENLVPIPDLDPYLYDSTTNMDQSSSLGIDLRYNILHQKISMVNCCIIRKLQNLPQNGNTKNYDTKPVRHPSDLFDNISSEHEYIEDAESDDSDIFLDAVEEESVSSASKQDSASSSLIIPNNAMAESFVSLPYIPASNIADELEAEAATIKDPKLSEGQSHKHDTLKLLKTGEVMQIPITQDPGFMTEDMIHEQANVFESLGTSENATQQRAKLQSAQLYSDMQAFKAANPFACLEDFVRWHSPKDWVVDDGEEGGHLSARMSEPSNIWQELWKCSRRIPCSRQKPLFNISVEAEKGLYFLETTSVYDFFSM
ncbi:Rab3 GTPase-activating protein catalytic subunit-domain-containing protein [Mucor mucedo]|uniref:Rab3 GTPase-activating protein catalytic subunit-domain-containing protein n=1 Tax=Mucor mucedo TaxID=29922 RepID=UPI00221FB597|nr:Rab3 GTPase-activating protein catalytic subunit-domain-containing protein [Mucor mucedo]KAI7891390.1 Rab3 GTPase-activating protein catalytic subunit-domain-containing protein [Mucor mucedo]